jgi:hypothetical protein
MKGSSLGQPYTGGDRSRPWGARKLGAREASCRVTDCFVEPCCGWAGVGADVGSFTHPLLS